MTSVASLAKDNFEHPKIPSRIDLFSNSPVNRALAHAAQEIAGLLQQSHPFQADNSKHLETIAIRAIEPEYRQAITLEPLTSRELEILQLIVDGHSNVAIAKNLYISIGTVKTHVRNIFKKLCVNDRTQAAIRALRSGLVC
ncbi:MAG TPA: response regulator transcription factor [Coleofasciculaceae cyanobacterium]